MVKFKQTPQLKVVKSNTAVGELESAELVLSQIKVGVLSRGLETTQLVWRLAWTHMFEKWSENS